MKTSLSVIGLPVRLALLATLLISFHAGCIPAGSPTAPNTAESQAATPQFPPTETPSPSSAPQDQITATVQTDAVSKMMAQVDRESVMADLRLLIGETPVCDENGCHTISNRSTGSRGLAWAKDFVKAELSGLGYSVDLFDWSRSGKADQDLIVKKPGVSRPEEEIYFVAHLDGAKTVWGNKFPAADDDASGVVDLLQLARVLRDHSFDRTIVLFFSTGEEQGTLGVESYIDQLSPEELSSIKFVINLDMLGYDANQDWAMELWHGGHAGSLALAELIGDTIAAHQFRLVPEFAVGCG